MFDKLTMPSATLMAALVLVACTPSTSGPSGPAGPSATPASTAIPSATTAPPSASVAPSVSPQASDAAEPTPTGSPGSTFDVDLLLSTGRTVTIKVKDDSGFLVEAASGTPGDGGSVPENTVDVANDGPAVVRLTWTGPPCATNNFLLIESGAARLTVVQPTCAGDSIPLDRVLTLTFSKPVSAHSIEAILQPGGDTAG